jgi:hypothetical protein
VDLPGEDLSGSFGQVKIVYRELNDSQTSFPAIMGQEPRQCCLAGTLGAINTDKQRFAIGAVTALD